jgi:hypothetical protein
MSSSLKFKRLVHSQREEEVKKALLWEVDLYLKAAVWLDALERMTSFKWEFQQEYPSRSQILKQIQNLHTQIEFFVWNFQRIFRVASITASVDFN